MFLSKIRTRQDLEFLNSDLDTISENIYKNNPDQRVPAMLSSGFAQAPDKAAFVEQVRKELLQAKFMELTVSVAFDEAQINKISDWVKANVGESVILDFKVDPKTFAGCDITYNGKHKDFSYGKIFTEVLEKTKL